MKWTYRTVFLVISCLFCCSFSAAAGSCCASASVAKSTALSHPSTDVYDGWRLGVQTWSLNHFTLFESIDKTRSLGLSWIQAFPGQRICADREGVFGPEMSAELRAAVKAKLQEASVGIFAYGVTGIPTDEKQARALFEFARQMGIETIASEPEFEEFDAIDKLCREYRIKLGIHNHPKPSRYWNPQTVLDVCKGRSPWIGACVDVGHWARSGLNPADCLKKLQGRIHDVHIKEVDTELGHDVVWGTGQGRIKGVLEELHRQGYVGTFSIEYEHQWENNLPQIRHSIAYFDTIASVLNPTGWRRLFADDLSNAELKAGSWVLQEGVLELVGGGDIWTKDNYDDFILDFDFRVQERTNSGVFLRAGDHNWLPWAEVQIEDSFGKDISRHICGAIFDVQAPTVNVMLPPSQWNRMTIQANGAGIQVVLNGREIVDINLDKWRQAGQNPDGSPNKFNIAYKDLPREGFIGFQDHRDGTKVWYRNISIKTRGQKGF